MSLFSGSLFLILCMFAEFPLLKLLKKVDIPWKEIVYNVNSGHIFMWIFRSAEVLVFISILNNFSLNLLESWSFPFQWVFTFFAWDFCFYWLHRMHHKIPLFWNIHVVHHEGEHFSLSLGLRNSWYSSLSSIPFFVALAIIGVPLEVFISVSAIHYFVQFYNHNGVVGDSGWLEHFMVTPARHRVHHGVNPEYVDKNFGGTLNIWDRMFGTFQPELKSVPIIYGIKNYDRTDNPFWGNNLPFMRSLKLKHPKMSYNKNPNFIISELFIATGGLALLCLWLYYIYYENQGLTNHQVSLFFLILLSTIALGSSSDGKYSGIVSWTFMSIVPNIFFMTQFEIYSSWQVIFFVAFLIHGIYGMKYIMKYHNNVKVESST